MVKKLTKKEAYLVWSVVCCFDKPITLSLKHKLYHMGRELGLTDKDRNKMREKYDKDIYNRIMDFGTWLAGQEEFKK